MQTSVPDLCCVKSWGELRPSKQMGSCSDKGVGRISLQIWLLEGVLLLVHAALVSGFCVNNYSPGIGSPDRINLQTTLKQYRLSSTETHIITTMANVTFDNILNYDNYEDMLLFNIDLDDSLLDGTACSSRDAGEYGDEKAAAEPPSWLVARLWFAGAYPSENGMSVEQPGFPDLRIRLAAEKHPNCELSDTSDSLFFDTGYERGLQQVVLKSPKHGSSERIRILVQKMKVTNVDDSPAKKFSLRSSHAALQFALVNITVSCAAGLTMEPCMTSYTAPADMATGQRPRQCYGRGLCVATPFVGPSDSSGLARSRCECDGFHTGLACQHPLMRLNPEQFVNVTVPLRTWVHLYVGWVPSERPPLFVEATLLPGYPRYSMDSYGAPFIMCVQPLPDYGDDPVSLQSSSRKLGAHCDLVGAAAGRLSHSKSYPTSNERAMVYLVSLYGREILYDNLFVSQRTFMKYADQRTEVDTSVGQTRILAPQLVGEFSVMLKASWFNSQPCPSYWNAGPCNGTGECQVIRGSQWQKGDSAPNSETTRQYSAFNNNLTEYMEQVPPAVCNCKTNQVTDEKPTGYNCQTEQTMAYLESKRPWKHTGLIGWPLSEVITVKLPDKAPECIQVSMFPLPCLSVWDPQAGNERLVFSEDVMRQQAKWNTLEQLSKNGSKRKLTEYRSVLQAQLDVSRFSFQEYYTGHQVIRLLINGQNCWPACMGHARPGQRAYFGGSQMEDPAFGKQDCPALDVAMAKSALPYYEIGVSAEASCMACEQYQCAHAMGYKYNLMLLAVLGGLPVLVICMLVWWRRRHLRANRGHRQHGAWRAPTRVPDDVVKTFQVYKYNPSEPLPKKGHAVSTSKGPSKLTDNFDITSSSPFVGRAGTNGMLPDRLLSTDMSITIGVGMLSASQTLSSSTTSALSQHPDLFLNQSGSLALSQELRRAGTITCVPEGAIPLQPSPCKDECPVNPDIAVRPGTDADSADIESGTSHAACADMGADSADVESGTSHAACAHMGAASADVESGTSHAACAHMGADSADVESGTSHAACAHVDADPASIEPGTLHTCGSTISRDEGDGSTMSHDERNGSAMLCDEQNGGNGSTISRDEGNGSTAGEVDACGHTLTTISQAALSTRVSGHDAKLHTSIPAERACDEISVDAAETNARTCQHDSLSVDSPRVRELADAVHVPPLTFSIHSPVINRSSRSHSRSSSRVNVPMHSTHDVSCVSTLEMGSSTQLGSDTKSGHNHTSGLLASGQQVDRNVENEWDVKPERDVELGSNQTLLASNETLLGSGQLLGGRQEVAGPAQASRCVLYHAHHTQVPVVDGEVIVFRSRIGDSDLGDIEPADEQETTEVPCNGHTPLESSTTDCTAGKQLEMVYLSCAPAASTTEGTATGRTRENSTAHMSHNILRELTTFINIQRRRRTRHAPASSTGSSTVSNVIPGVSMSAANSHDHIRGDQTASTAAGSTESGVQNGDQTRMTPSNLWYRPFSHFTRMQASLISPHASTSGGTQSQVPTSAGTQLSTMVPGRDQTVMTPSSLPYRPLNPHPRFPTARQHPSQHPSTLASTTNAGNTTSDTQPLSAFNKFKAFGFDQDSQAARPHDEDADEDSDRTCMICLLEYEEDDDIMLLPCWHAFHKDCIMQWMSNHVTCPACRHCLVPNPEEAGAINDQAASSTPTTGS